MFVYGDAVYAQTRQVLTLKNRIEPLSYASTAYVAASYGLECAAGTLEPIPIPQLVPLNFATLYFYTE